MATRVLSLPGWNGSEPSHWQSLWERLDARIVRVEQASWTKPTLEDWKARVVAALEASPEPTVLLGHSLGAILAVHVAGASAAKHVVGAMLVAVPDLEHPSFEALPTMRSFFPVPSARLPWPTTLVWSEDDPWCVPDVSLRLSEQWGAIPFGVGKRGHINADSGLETWPEGLEALRRLRTLAPFCIDPRLAADTHLIGRGPLSELRLFDDARYPWFVLVPRRTGAEDVSQLTVDERAQLEQESAALVAGLHEAFGVDKVNVASLGNVVRQLHLHHVGRRLDDPAWPGPVWGHSPRVSLAAPIREARVSQLFRSAAVLERFTRGQ